MVRIQLQLLCAIVLCAHLLRSPRIRIAPDLLFVLFQLLLHPLLLVVLQLLLHAVLLVIYRSCYTGCGLLSRWAYRCRTNHYNYYWGCGYSPSCTICGATDCGCGMMDYGVPADAMPADAVPSEPSPADPGAVPDQQTSTINGSALLSVSVPQDARILVNGVATRSTGEQRRYVSRNLIPGFEYTYEVKAEMVVDGKPVTRVKTVQLRAGQQAELAFQADAPASLETALTVHVPANAEVYLAGNATKGTGTTRTFRTKKLSDGASWQDYVVRVVVNEDGDVRAKEQKITLRAGEQRELTFDFDISRVAAR